MYKKIISFALISCIAALSLAACNNNDVQTSSSEPGTPASVAGVTSGAGDSSASQESDEPNEEKVQAMYDAIAEAAGLSATVPESLRDLELQAGVDTDNILAYVGNRSVVGGDSGLVMVMQVEPGKAEDTIAQLEAYRDALLSGPGYEEFADSQEATKNARIVAEGNFVVYAAVSANAGASYTDVDAALTAAFAL